MNLKGAGVEKPAFFVVFRKIKRFSWKISYPRPESLGQPVSQDRFLLTGSGLTWNTPTY